MPSPGLARRLACLCLLSLGLFLMIETPSPLPSRGGDAVQFIAALAAAALALLPPVRRVVGGWLDRLRDPSPGAVARAAVAIALTSALYLIFSGLRQGRDFLPKYHDEFMYLLQARMLTTGRLWMPSHPLADFFETFHVLVRPVYAPVYFPGTGLLYAGVLAAHLEPMLASAFVCGAIVALMYVVVTHFTDGVGGWLAALLTLALPFLHYLSLMVMSHSVVVLLALAMIGAYLRWRTRQAALWALSIGICAGWALVTRPLDDACFIAPLGAAMLWDLRGHGRSAVGSVIFACAGAAPFIALQLAMNVGITGRVLDNPVSYYDRMYWPGISLSGHEAVRADWRPPTRLAQFQDYYRDFLVPQLDDYARASTVEVLRSRWPDFYHAALPCRLTLLLAPAGVLGVARRRRWVLLAMVPLYVAGYARFPAFLPHYAFVAAPAMILAVVLGARACEDIFPRRRALVAAMLTLALTAAALTSLTELNPFLQDPYYRSRLLADVSLKLADLPHTPAVVLFRYSGGGQQYHEEPVYNLDTAWPDDATVIRAHDLGPAENQRIYRYYAQGRQQRFFYLYDRKTFTLTELGWARDLADK